MAAILAVDDEKPILELIKKGLQKDGHTVTGYPCTGAVLQGRPKPKFRPSHGTGALYRPDHCPPAWGRADFGKL